MPITTHPKMKRIRASPIAAAISLEEFKKCPDGKHHLAEHLAGGHFAVQRPPDRIQIQTPAISPLFFCRKSTGRLN